MPAAERRRYRALLSLALLLCGILLALPINHPAPPPGPVETSATLFDDARFAIQLGRNRLRTSGTSTSEEHEAALLRLAGEQFPNVEIDAKFGMAAILPADWETLSLRLLYLVATSESAHATIEANRLAVRGISRDGSEFEHRRQFLEDAVGTGRALSTEVVVIDNSATFDDLCRRNFASFAAEPIRFRQSSTQIRPSSYPLLDKIAEFAYDCSTSSVAIIGHSDATGPAAWNLKVSRSRAEAVAAELEQRGINREQLIIEGHGALHAIADNTTVSGREQNRRVEFELR
jgi:outer membrane protein OmpA-like peptidoglycan-associated protein